jgi:hypothetical protein
MNQEVSELEALGKAVEKIRGRQVLGKTCRLAIVIGGIELSQVR